MIKATIVLLAACIVIPHLHRRSAAERHALWTAALAVAAVLPVLIWLLPAWEPAWAQRAADTWPGAFERSSPSFSAGDIVVRATGIDSGRSMISSIGPVLWTAVSMLLLLRLVVQALQLTRLTSSGTPANPRPAAIGQAVATALGLPVPRLTCSERISIPLAWGVRRARVLLPPASHDWPDQRVWAVCAHELAHISRGDWIVHLLAEIACRIYWFNPLFWLARNRLSRESERAADDIVIGLGASGADYASHLIEILRAARPDLSPTPAVGMVRRRTTRFGDATGESGFERRIAALVNAVMNRTRLSRNRALAILAAACVLAGPLAALSASARSTIEIRTSNLPPIVDSAVRELASDGSDPVRQIRVVDRVAEHDVAPSVAEYTTPPLYSDDARRAGIEGVVVVLVQIDANGRVKAARVVRGLGFGLDQNALVALRQWRFHPGTRHGVATPLDVEIEIGFTLRNESINAQIANDMVSLVGPGITPPQAVRVVSVRPSGATAAAGIVVLDVVLLENGTPRIVRILRSLGADADEMAVRTFEQWRFSPALKDGRPIKVRMNAEVRFHG